MSQYLSATVRDVINWVDQEKLVLPSMQRNYVWTPEKICDLFDSLASGYPIGTFLFWEIDREGMKDLIFNAFISSHNEQDLIQRGSPVTARLDQYYAVLDGQQRITSLNIGIRGKLRLRKKKRSTKFVDKFLAINIFYDSAATSGEATNHYMFDFREAEDLKKLPVVDDVVDYDAAYWVSVGEIADENFDAYDFMDCLFDEIDERGFAYVPRQKQKMIRNQLVMVSKSINEAPAVSYYNAKNKNLAEVVDIFVRVNSGGQKLSASDLMLSIASGSAGVDAQRVISEAIDLVGNATVGEGVFPADKELLIRAGLMFTGSDSLSLSNKNNYSTDRIERIFVDEWDDIVDSLQHGVRLLEWLGFNVERMSKNLLLPIAYYLYKKNPAPSFYTITSGKDAADKLLIRQWVIRAIVRSIFRDGTGSTLIFSRNVIDSSSPDHFPIGKFLEEGSARSLRIGDESIDEMLRLTYGDPVIKPLLSAIAKRDDVVSLDVDHMWPQSVVLSKKRTKRYYPNITDREYFEFKKRLNNITNLQLLQRADNIAKSDMLYDEWVDGSIVVSRLPSYCEETCVDPEAPRSFASFLDFTNKRAKIMRRRIAEEFPDDIEKKVFPNLAK